MKRPYRCDQCEAICYAETGHINRARKRGYGLFCNRTCAGLARRVERTASERQALKSAYDRQRRAELGDELRAAKRAAYHAAVTADPIGQREKERIERKRRAADHAAYCRRPSYRKWKAEYDRQHRARKEFGDFGEAAIVLNELCSEIAARSTFTERAIAKGNLNKRNTRRRDYEQQTDRR